MSNRKEKIIRRLLAARLKERIESRFSPFFERILISFIFEG